jgi:restriction system protein
MKLIAVKCPNCGADLEYEEGMTKMFCRYCGTPVILDDESLKINITNRIVDEAEIEKVKLQRTQYEHRYEKEQQQERDYAEKERAWKQLLMEYLGGLGVTLFLAMAFQNTSSGFLNDVVTGLFGAVLIFGGIAVWVMKPKNGNRPEQNNARSYGSGYRYIERSDKSQAAAMLLCVFAGYFGAHYFYVRRPGMGIVYLFTLGLFGLGWLYDCYRIAVGKFPDDDGRPLR